MRGSTLPKPFEASAFNLRMPPELKERLMAAAKENGRSLNGEICYRLRQSLREKYS